MKEKWTIEVNNTKYDDLKTYTILEPNPEAGKSSVYSGSYFGVCTLDSKEDTNLIVSAVNACIEINPDKPQAVAEAIKDMYEATRIALDLVKTVLYNHPDDDIAQEQKKVVENAIAKIEGR